MALQEIWLLMNQILRSDVNSEVDRKMSAINEGFLYFAKTMLTMDSYLPELLSSLTELASVEDSNKITLPTDYLGLMSMWYGDGTNYTYLEDGSLVDLDYLIRQSNTQFISNDTGIPYLFSISEPYIYTDKGWDAVYSDAIKLMYHKKPATLISYDEIPVVSVTGYVINEVIIQDASNAIAQIYEIDTDNSKLKVKTSSRQGFFLDTYAVVGQTSLTSSLQNADIIQKPQVLEISSKYTLELATASAFMYLWFDDDSETESKEQTFIEMIEKLGTINKMKSNYKIRMA